MAEKIEEARRSRLGYGSTYKRKYDQDFGKTDGIGAVLSGQAWQVKPDREAGAVNPCIWMQAGVVEFKNCNNFYDCTTCKYDVGMRMKAEKGEQVSWQDAMRRRSDLDRTCRHSMTYRIGKRACHHNYDCSRCEFDQFFEDVWSAKINGTPGNVQQIRGFGLPMDYYFHNGHAWARIESGGAIRIGLDDFVLKVLGKADAMDLPLMGKELDQNAAGWGLKRKGNTADVLSPVGGVIVEVNAKVRENPELANQEPYGDGWLFMVRTPDIKRAMKNLMTGTTTVDWINGEISHLETMIEGVAGPLTADGGYLAEDVYGNIPQLSWNNLTKTFLKTG